MFLIFFFATPLWFQRKSIPHLISKKIHPRLISEKIRSKPPRKTNKIAIFFALCVFWICSRGLFAFMPMDLNFTNPNSTIFEKYRQNFSIFQTLPATMGTVAGEEGGWVVDDGALQRFGGGLSNTRGLLPVGRRSNDRRQWEQPRGCWEEKKKDWVGRFGGNRPVRRSDHRFNRFDSGSTSLRAKWPDQIGMVTGRRLDQSNWPVRSGF